MALPPEACGYEHSAVVVLPIPYEATVSGGAGTRHGPSAFIAASQQLTYYSLATNSETVFEYGIHTLPELPVRQVSSCAPSDETVMCVIAETVAAHARNGKFVLGLGGEHSASFPFAHGLAQVHGNFTLIQIDAHPDLCDECDGNRYSHACGVRRITELPQCDAIYQLGIRSGSGDQVLFAEMHEKPDGPRPFIRTWQAEAMHEHDGWKEDLAQGISGKKVIVTLDVDGLDPSIVPSTGTPEPDGLTWRQLLTIMKIIAANVDTVIGMDCMEFSPIPGLPYPDYTMAQALYTTLNIMHSHGRIARPGRGGQGC